MSGGTPAPRNDKDASARIPNAITNVACTINGDSEFNRHYTKALDAAVAGKWTLANDELSRASVLFPSSPDLIRVRHDINREMQAMPVWQRHPFAATAVGVSAVGLIAGSTNDPSNAAQLTVASPRRPLSTHQARKRAPGGAAGAGSAANGRSASASAA